MADQLKESGHWYTGDGEPCYTQPDGKNTTLRHARKQDLLPSVTTIIKVAAAPGLEIWKQNQLLEAAWNYPFHANLTVPDESTPYYDLWRKTVLTASQERAKQAREAGTAAHAALQGYYEGKGFGGYEALCKRMDDTLRENCGSQEWTAEKSFAHPLGFGGKVDLHALGHYWVVDFKGTDKPLETLKTWDEHAMQLAAYREGLGLQKACCAIVYFHRDTHEVRLIELDEAELRRGWLMFESLLAFWKAQKNYDPQRADRGR